MTMHLPRSRRPHRLLSCALAVALIAAACGDANDETASASEPETTDTSDGTSESGTAPDADVDTETDTGAEGAAEGEEVDEPPIAAFPVEVEHALGVTTIESAPERIVVLGDGIELATLLALDVQPSAAGQLLPLPQPWIEERLSPDAEVFEAALVNVEFVAALEPDLIIGGDSRFGENPELWSGVAPWVAVPGFGWTEALRIISEATGQQTRAEEVREATLAAIDSFDDDLAASAPTMSVLFAGPDGSGSVLNAENPLSELLVDMGLPALPDPLEGFASAGPGGDIIPAEQIGLIDTDAIIIADPAGQGALEMLESNPLWESLPAVQAGRVTVLSGTDVFLTFIDSALTIPIQVDLFERLVMEFNAS